MGAIVGTKLLNTTLSGKYKLVTITAPVAATSDTIAITQAAHGISAVTAIVGAVVTGGLDAAFTAIQVTLTDDKTLTVVSLEQDGTAATDFTGTTIAVTVLGY